MPLEPKDSIHFMKRPMLLSMIRPQKQANLQPKLDVRTPEETNITEKTIAAYVRVHFFSISNHLMSN